MHHFSLLRNRYFHTVFVFALFFLSRCSVSHAQTTPVQPAGTSAGTLPVAPEKPPRYYYTIPFTPAELYGAPLVKLQFDKEHSANFVFDTGTYFSILHPELVDALELERKPLPAPFASLRLLASDMEYVMVDHADIGNYLPTSGMFFVTDRLTRYIHDKTIEGVMTGDVFLPAAVLLDFEKQTMTTISGGVLTDAQLAALGFDDGTTEAIDLTPTDDSSVPRFMVRGRIVGGQHAALEGNLMLDTGASSTTFVGDPAKIYVVPFTQSKMFTLQGIMTSSIGRVDSIEVERHNQTQLPALSLSAACNFNPPVGEAQWVI